MKTVCKKTQGAGFRKRFQDFKNELSGCNVLFITDVSLKSLKKNQMGTVKIPPANCLLGKSFCQALFVTSRESKLYI